ncbi:MAG: M48 family metallopeptidase, partial [Rhodospirillales bacterium]|nr:M48 family metallopeptidase [Rhodospirillales bacterium]
MLNLLKSSDKKSLTLDGTDVTVTIKRNVRAKRMILRLDPKAEAGVIVTLPKRVPASEALEMVQRKRSWVVSRLANRPDIIPFKDGGSFPFRGQEHRIEHHPDKRGTVWLTPGILNVAGGEEHLSRRLTDWLKKEAKARLAQQTAHYSQQLGESMGRLTVRDTSSRWGSCSAQGNLSFS